MDTTADKMLSPGSLVTGIIRQIIQDPSNTVLFIYFIRAPPGFQPYY
jgi:hypothetical protein